MNEGYGVSADAYLARAEARIASDKREELFYAALELRSGIESRMQEYLDVQKHISKQKKKGWQIAKLGRHIEHAFRLGDEVVEITVTDPESDEPVAVFYYTPVKAALRRNAERLGDYLHALSHQKVSDEKWWSQFRALLIETVAGLREATEGVLLGPPMMHRSKKQMHMNISGFATEELKYLTKRMKLGQQMILRVEYLASVPKDAKSRIFESMK